MDDRQTVVLYSATPTYTPNITKLLNHHNHHNLQQEYDEYCHSFCILGKL